MKSYWTCSKFADWIRGTMKPQSERLGDGMSGKLKLRKTIPFATGLLKKVLTIYRTLSSGHLTSYMLLSTGLTIAT